MVDSTPTPGDDRKPVSRRLRFEILRRDNFTCRYCGGSAPDVTLAVDHVIPTALGGGDDPTNLITACTDCNNGKASINMGDDTVADVTEATRLYAEALEAAANIERDERDQTSAFADEFRDRWNKWKFVGGVRGGQSIRLPSVSWRGTILNYAASGLTMDDLNYAIEVCMAKTGLENDTAIWRYFCGVCRATLTKRHEIAQRILDDGA
jgi:hypothetical protein